VVGQADGLRQVAIEDETEPPRAAQQLDLAGDAGTERLVLDLTDELVEKVAVVRHVVSLLLPLIRTADLAA
jgi:hypothetical protein